MQPGEKGPPAAKPAERPSIADRLFTAVQVPLPHHLLTRVVHALARVRWRPFSRLLIAAFRRAYRIDLAEAAEPDPRAYPTFNAFFTRQLAPGARPVVAAGDRAACPVDGTVSRVGTLDGDRLLQAKGRPYRLADLFGGVDEAAAPFAGGAFATLYLAPHNYHRIHMPLAGRLLETVYVPGRLYAVNPATARALPRLFTRNERLAAVFDTDAGRMALVLVGALFVGAIETVWDGLVTPPRRRAVERRRPVPPVALERGREMGRFNMGSTVIVLFEPGRARWAPGLESGVPVRMGQPLARLETALPAGGDPRSG